jgi:hypothetical protein
MDDMLNGEGKAFSQAYFDFERGPFLVDYEQLLGKSLPTLYHVADTWENYDLLKARIDERFAT